MTSMGEAPKRLQLGPCFLLVHWPQPQSCEDTQAACGEVPVGRNCGLLSITSISLQGHE